MTTAFWASYVALSLVTLTLCAAVFALYHHFAQAYLATPAGRSAQGPVVGTALSPDHRMSTLDGQRVSLITTAPSLVLLLTKNCPACDGVTDAVRVLLSEQPELRTLVNVSGCDDKEAHLLAERMPYSVSCGFDTDHSMAAALRIGTLPFVIAVDSTGIVREKGLVDDICWRPRTLDVAAHEK
jgi:hypothetical protein